MGNKAKDRKCVSVKKLSARKRGVFVPKNVAEEDEFFNVEPVRSEVCPFDLLPCSHVADCDDVLSLPLGTNMVEGDSCPRVVYNVRKK